MTFPLPARRTPPTASWRWLAVLALSVLLHLLVLGWGADSLRWPAPHRTPQPLLEAALLAPPPRLPPAMAPAAAPPAKKSPPRPRRPAPRPPPPAAPEMPAAPTAAITPDRGEPVPSEPLPPLPVVSIGIGQGDGSGNDANAAADPAAATSTAAVTPPEPVSPPPSVTLKYDVEAWRDGQRVYGHGSIVWHTDGQRYRIEGDAGILFFSVLRFTSEGLIDRFGVAPVLYNEKRFRKSATNTHFQRERQLISFSASTATYPRQGGEQDRASVIWQLASIGRSDSGHRRFIAGADIDLFVAGARDAESWRLHIAGQEHIEIDGQPTVAWHVVRAPRPGSYDQQIDIWLAPEQEWYPVKLRYTETSGDYLDLLLSNIKPPSPVAAPANSPATNQEWIN